MNINQKMNSSDSDYLQLILEKEQKQEWIDIYNSILIGSCKNNVRYSDGTVFHNSKTRKDIYNLSVNDFDDPSDLKNFLKKKCKYKIRSSESLKRSEGTLSWEKINKNARKEFIRRYLLKFDELDDSQKKILEDFLIFSKGIEFEIKNNDIENTSITDCPEKFNIDDLYKLIG